MEDTLPASTQINVHVSHLALYDKNFKIVRCAKTKNSVTNNSVPDQQSARFVII
jgi:hypothetical protein